MASAALLKASATKRATRPRFPPYREPGFVSAVQIARKACGDARDLLKEWPDPKPLRCIEEMESLADYEPPTEFMVGVIGVSGVGKSSTINSIFDQQELAKAEACGSAVTHYPVQYRQSTGAQKAEHVIEAKRQPFHSLHLYIAQLLHDYNRPQMEDEAAYLDTSEFAEMKLKQTEAKNIFDALFGNMQSYSDATLAIGEDHKLDPALARLAALATNLRYPEGTDAEGVWRGEADSTETLNDKLSFIIDSGLWPIVESVKISSKAQTLGRHLVVVDLPGNQDTNVARVRSAMKYQSKCDLLLVVVDMKRAVDDSLVEQTVEMIRRKPMFDGNLKLQVAVVCTRAGVLSTNAEEQKMREKVKNQSRLMHLLKALDDLDKVEEMPIKEYKKRERDLRRQYNRMLIQARNEDVSTKLKAKYGGDLEVFCVDNALYWDEHPNDETEQQISGIQQLREFLADLPHESLFKHQDSFLKHSFPACIASFQTWAVSCLIDQRLDERKEVPQPKTLEANVQQVQHFFDKIERIFTKHIDAALVTSATAVRSRCVNVLQPIIKWHPSSVRAWMRHRGTHTTRSRGYKCWNQDLVRCFADVLAQPWNRLTAETSAQVVSLNIEISMDWKTYSQQCSSLDPDSPIAISAVARLPVVQDCIRNSMLDFDQHLAKIRHDATLMHPACYVKQLLEQGYAEASGPMGKNMFDLVRWKPKLIWSRERSD